MIKMMTAYTEEVDEVEDGLDEIMGQVSFGDLKKNSVGLVTCHIDFAHSGFIGKLCEKLPFDIIGMTTMASANQHGQGMYSLSLSVLTSDDVAFSTGMTGALRPDNYRNKIIAAYADTAGKLPGKPSLIFPFFPYLSDLSGALMHRCFNEACGGIPFYGSLATNINVSYERCHAFRNDESDEDGMVMLLMHGPVDPEFVLVSVPTENIRRNRGLVTGSDGCLLKEVNGLPANKYMETLGITLINDAPIVTPLMVYYEKCTEPVALGMYSVNDDGSIMCGGELPAGASVAIGEITSDGILASAREGMNRVLGCGKRNGAVILPCVSRYVMLVPNQNDEMSIITSMMDEGRTMPFAAGYSGGELCPVPDEAGVLRNRFHNYTFSACVF